MRNQSNTFFGFIARFSCGILISILLCTAYFLTEIYNDLWRLTEDLIIFFREEETIKNPSGKFFGCIDNFVNCAFAC